MCEVMYSSGKFPMIKEDFLKFRVPKFLLKHLDSLFSRLPTKTCKISIYKPVKLCNLMLIFQFSFTFESVCLAKQNCTCRVKISPLVNLAQKVNTALIDSIVCSVPKVEFAMVVLKIRKIISMYFLDSGVLMVWNRRSMHARNIHLQPTTAKVEMDSGMIYAKRDISEQGVLLAIPKKKEALQVGAEFLEEFAPLVTFKRKNTV